MSVVESVRRAMAGGSAVMPLAALMNFRLTAITPGHACVEMNVDATHANPVGTVHGGVLCTIADSAMGLAYASTLEERETFATVELKINFLRPVYETALIASGVVVHRGRNLGLVECSVTDRTGRLVAKATSTFITLRDGRVPTE
jgi:uncharacterized protein (TIGR00369 family)